MTEWKRKLAAYLHDPPSKALDIRTHGERSDAAFNQAGFSDSEVGEYFAHADHTAAAMDRLPFPRRCVSRIFPMGKELRIDTGSRPEKRKNEVFAISGIL